MRFVLLMAMLACDSTSRSSPGDGGPAVDFVIAGISFHAGSGVAVTSGGTLTLYLSDQPDTCQALTYVPVGTATTFSLRIAPPLNGSTRAAVVGPKSTPAAGEAVGGLSRATGGVKNASVDAMSGSIAWTANAGGSVTIDAIDVGFVGTTDRLTTGGLTLTPCSP